ncbi:MAG: hypothetical protein ACLT0Y_02090 [Christensenellales bacterium]
MPMAESAGHGAVWHGQPHPHRALNNVRVISSSPLGKTGEHAKYVLKRPAHRGYGAFRIKARICRGPTRKSTFPLWWSWMNSAR